MIFISNLECRNPFECGAILLRNLEFIEFAKSGNIQDGDGALIDSWRAEQDVGDVELLRASQDIQHEGDDRMKKLLMLALIGSLFVGVAFVQENAVTTKSGLKYVDLKLGTGDEAKKGMTVTVHYTGWLYSNGRRGAKFDSSVDRGQPFGFKLGAGEVIRGWDEGVAGMKVGGKRELFIPPNLGYGSTGAGGVIPPNATLDFEVQLLKVAK